MIIIEKEEEEEEEEEEEDMKISQTINQIIASC